MDAFILHSLIIVLTALFFSAFFSGMEIAFLSSNKLKLEIDKKQMPVFGYIATLFTKRPGEYITTILIGNNIALVIYSLQMSALLGLLLGEGMAMENSVLVDTLISTVIIIFFAEYLPKTVVKSNPNGYFRALVYPVYFFYLLFYPLSKFATWLSRWLLRLLGIKIHSSYHPLQFNKIDLASLVADGNESEASAETDKDIRIFQNALDFSDIRVRECMIRRVDIEAVDIETSVEELKGIFIESHFSRLPIYEGSIDNIIGYVTNKSLFKNPESIKSVLLKVNYVPETMSAQKLLASFIKTKHSIAIVLDEFGVTAGMVTLEDILEEIFGEINDEYDVESLVDRQVSPSEYIFSGRLEVEDINEKYNIDIPENEEYDTLAGYIIYQNEGFPKQGEVVVTDRFKIQILKMNSSKIELVRLHLLG